MTPVTLSEGQPEYGQGFKPTIPPTRKQKKREWKTAGNKEVSPTLTKQHKELKTAGSEQVPPTEPTPTEQHKQPKILRKQTEQEEPNKMDENVTTDDNEKAKPTRTMQTQTEQEQPSTSKQSEFIDDGEDSYHDSNYDSLDDILAGYDSESEEGNDDSTAKKPTRRKIKVKPKFKKQLLDAEKPKKQFEKTIKEQAKPNLKKEWEKFDHKPKSKKGRGPSQIKALAKKFKMSPCYVDCWDKEVETYMNMTPKTRERVWRRHVADCNRYRKQLVEDNPRPKRPHGNKKSQAQRNNNNTFDSSPTTATTKYDSTSHKLKKSPSASAKGTRSATPNSGPKKSASATDNKSATPKTGASKFY